MYKAVVSKNINKLVNCFNFDVNLKTLGYGDRDFWAWKVKDFANGTFQGGIHSLAIAYKLNIFSNKDLTYKIIDNSIKALERIQRRNGSLEEAFPNENSFCVTALVAFDCLSAIKLLEDELNSEQKEAYLEIIKPLITFISKNDETHAIISNHLATGVAAILIWNKLTGKCNQRFKELLNILYKHQSNEGWYKEYEGADPGYQTLCTYYLVAAYQYFPDQSLKNSIDKSIEFLKYFIHPNGSIGGLYGSRNTEVYYPGGITAWTYDNTTAKAINKKIEEGIAIGQNILPQDIDAGNFIPLLNSYAFAALNEKENFIEEAQLPYLNVFEKDFQETGIFIKSTSCYYVIINYKKGGTLKVFDKKTNELIIEDGGFFGVLNNHQTISTQFIQPELTFENKEVNSKLFKVNENYPSPFHTIIIRLFSISIFYNKFLRETFKKMIVRLLMTNKLKIKGNVTRKFEFDEDKIKISDSFEIPNLKSKYQFPIYSKAIHMASSGYGLKQNCKSKLIEYHEI